jgi:membrane-bound lytic murein transglycosylase A
MRGLAALYQALAGLVLGFGAVAADAPRAFRSEPASFATLEGWAGDDHQAAFGSFRRSCPGVMDGSTATGGRAPEEALVAACRAALRDSEP